MPLTKKGKKVKRALNEQYGERAEEVFYALKNKGKLKGVDAMADLFERFEEDRVRKTIKRNKRGGIISTSEEEEEEDGLGVIERINDGTSIMRDMLVLELDDAAAATMIDNGYMRAMPKIARTGIQLYHGRECGRDSMEKVRVYRPQDSVFATDAVKSYTHLPVTIEHPGVPVDARNWRKFAVGETGDEVLRDGGTVRVPMMLRDAAAIQAIKDGKNQISVGYSCDLDWEEGITPDGEKYDAVQRNIRGNHVAIVSTARGGPELKFGDEGDDAMDLKTVTIDGITCAMDANALAMMKKLQDQNENFAERFKKKKKGEAEEEEEDGLKSEALKKDLAAKDAAIAVKDKELTDLQAKLTDALSPARLHQRVKDLAAVIDRATKIVGKPIKCDGMSDADIRREVVNAKLGDVAKGWDDNKIEAAFDAITITTGTTSASNPIRDAVAAFGSRPGFNFNQSMDARDQAYYDSVKADENAWRNKPAQ